MVNKSWVLITLLTILSTATVVGCASPAETVTLEVTEFVELEGETIEVTVVETVVHSSSKDLVICMSQEPDALYPPGSSMLAATAVRHAIWTSNYTELSFDYQPVGITKMPSLADGDAVINTVEVTAGETIVNSAGNAATLTTGVEIVTADGETIVFDGTPVLMPQLIVDFEIVPRKFSDGEDVTADDYLFTYNIYKDPDTGHSSFIFDRTKSYEAAGELKVRWTGVPGFLDSTYFTNAIPGGIQEVFPEHLWSDMTAAELVETMETNRFPVGDGAFRVTQWHDGDRIVLEPNEYYYRADEGLPYLDSVTFKFIPETNQMLEHLLSGACDIATHDGLTVDRYPFLVEAELANLLIPYFQTSTLWEHIDFGINPESGYANTRPDWFEDARVRQAMTMCTDRQSMVDDIFYARTQVIHTYIPNTHPLYAEGLTEWPYDVDAANQLLDEVGFIDTDGDGIREDPETGTPFAPKLITTSSNEVRQQLTQIFKENQLDCGIDVQLEYQPTSKLFAGGPEGPLFGTQFDLGEFAWNTGIAPPCEFYLSSQIPNAENNWAGQNEVGFVNDAFDAACLKGIGNLPDTNAYVEGHKEAQQIFSEQLPVLPLFLRLKVAAARPEVLNFNVDATQNSELYNIFEFDLQQ